MKKYDKDATCIKCGGGIEDKYQIERTQDMADFMTAIDGIRGGPLCQPRPEHIQRTCKNCGYSWSEKPLHASGFDAFVDVFTEHIMKATGMTKEELLKRYERKADKVVGVSLDVTKDGIEIGTPLIHICKTKKTLDKLAERMSPKPDKIEVGDVVKAACLRRDECEVIGSIKGEGFAALHSKHDALCACKMRPLSDLDLIRKGPKVHVFEGIKVKAGEARDFIQLPFMMKVNKIVVTTPIETGKNYTMTLTEEDNS